MIFSRFNAQRLVRIASALAAVMVASQAQFSIAQTGYGQSAPVVPDAAKSVGKAEEPKETIRVEISKPMLAAEKLLAEKKYRDVLGQIAEAEKVPDKTPFELYVLDRMRALAALGVGNDALAVKSLESAYATGRVPAVDKMNFLDGIARIHYRLKDYKQAALWAGRALKEPGARIETRLMLGHSSYVIEDFATAKSEMAIVIANAEKSGTALPEDNLRLLGIAALKTNDDATYLATLEKLVLRYPKKEYWADLIYRTLPRAGVAERLILDLYRLKLITGVMSEKREFLDMASLTLQSGFPVEAQKAIDAAIAAKVLEKDTRVENEKKLIASIGKELAEENARAAKGNQPAPKGSVGLLNNGFDSVLKGDPKKGLEMMQAGLKASDLRRPEDAKLRYGIAQVLAGQKPQASETLKAIKGAEGAAELAHLWDVFARQAGG